MGGSSEYAAQQQELRQLGETISKLEGALEEVHNFIVLHRLGDALKLIEKVVYIEGVDYGDKDVD